MLNIILALAALFLIYQYFESFWSYKISKPHAWEEAKKNKELPKDLLRLERRYRDRVRFYNLWFQINRLKKGNVPGAMAEVGVHKGTTAKAIHLMDRDRRFYLFDTFEGFSESDLKQEKQQDVRFSTEMFSDTTLEQVQAYLGDNENLIFKKGFFPETAVGLESETFSLVNVDADLYAPTLTALQFFYPRLNAGGVLIVHDYNHNWDGARKAVDEFLLCIPESPIELPDWQGSVMVIKNRRN